MSDLDDIFARIDPDEIRDLRQQLERGSNPGG